MKRVYINFFLYMFSKFTFINCNIKNRPSLFGQFSVLLLRMLFSMLKEIVLKCLFDGYTRRAIKFFFARWFYPTNHLENFSMNGNAVSFSVYRLLLAYLFKRTKSRIVVESFTLMPTGNNLLPIVIVFIFSAALMFCVLGIHFKIRSSGG